LAETGEFFNIGPEQATSFAAHILSWAAGFVNTSMKKVGIQSEPKTFRKTSDCDCLASEATRRDFLNRVSSLAFAALVASGVESKDACGFPLIAVCATLESDECSYPIPFSDSVSIDQGNQVILVRHANHIYAFPLACPHENAALSWQPQDGRFRCPRHQAKYQPDGSFISGRATRNMDRFDVRIQDQKVVVALNKLYDSERQKSQWEAAFVALQ
jgi:nitrite reductase/ring-hydroxylating ferredoxin subunit